MNSNGIITAPVTVTDVKTVLGAPWNSVGGLCSDGRINPWSRFKPVQIANVAPNRNEQWWKGEFGDCGFDTANARCLHYSDIPDKVDGMSNGWAYKPPFGTARAPYRLADFDKYDHNAIKPVRNLTVTSKVIKGDDVYIGFLASMPSIDKTGPGSITFDDIKIDGATTTLDNFYTGVVIADGGRIVDRKTTDTADGMGLVSYNTSNLSLGTTYKVYPFFSRERLFQGGTTDPQNLYVTIPYLSYGSFKVVTAEELNRVTLVVSGRYIKGTGWYSDKIEYTMYVGIESGSRTFNKNGISVRFTSSDPLDYIQMGETNTDIPEFTVTPDTPYTWTDTHNVSALDESYYIYATLDTGKYKAKSNVLMPML